MGTSRGQLARAQEQRQVARREQEQARAEIQRYYTQQHGLDAVSGNMLRDDVKRHTREAREREAEQQALQALYTADAERELSTLRAAEEEALCSALSKQAAAEEAAAREVQRLREESSELRELREKLRMARVNKERALQLAEKAELAAREAQYERAYDEVIMRKDAEGLRAQQEAEAARRTAGKMGMKAIEQQMQDRLELQAEAEREFRRERDMVDEVVRRIQQEDAMEAAARRSKQEETKAYIARYLQQHVAEVAAKKEAAAREDARIAEYWAMVREREGREAARQKERRDAAARIYDQLRLEAEAKQREKEEEDYLIDLMREEEQAEKRRRDAEAAAEKREASKREMLAANAEMLRLKAEREAREREEEEKFRAAAMARFAEDDRIEQMNAQRRRMKVQEHKRAVDAMVEERRQMYEAARAAEAAQEESRRAEEARQAAIVEEERRKLLAQAADLQGFLPRGVLRDKADAELLRTLGRGGVGSGAGAAGPGVQAAGTQGWR